MLGDGHSKQNLRFVKGATLKLLNPSAALGEMIDRYIKDIIPTKPKNVKNRTLHLNWWKSELGEYALAEVTPALIAEHRDKLSSGITRFGEKRSPSTVIRYMAAIENALQMRK
jgi:hypothetical protein